MLIKNFLDKRGIWIGLGAISLLLRYTSSPETIEQYYSRGLFLWIRKIIDIGVGWFPIPLIYVFFGILLIWLISKIRRIQWQGFFQWKHLLQTTYSFLAFLGGVLFFFFLLWGYNYGRIPLVTQLGLQVKPTPVATLKQSLEKTTEEAIRVRTDIVGDKETALDKTYLPQNMETLVRQSVLKTLKELGYPAVSKVRGRLLVPKGIFLRFGTAGLYWPFVGEGNIDSGLHELQQPFTLAHELAHGYGITNEGVCNFIAYLACQNSENDFIRYAGLVAYWRYAAIAYQGFEREAYWEFRETLPKGLQADMDAINDNLDKYPDILPTFRNYAYDKYLKSQGISEGLASYSQIIMLVDAWERR